MKILFVHQHPSTFVKKDLEILRSAHNVREIHFQGAGSIFRLWQGVRWCDMSFSWFGKLHAFFAVLFSKIWGKRSIVVAGGDDVAKKTGFGRHYGIFAHPLKRCLGDFIFRYTDLVVAISEYNYGEVTENTPAASGKVKLIYHGFDSNTFRKLEGIAKGDIVITVGNVDCENYWRKGFYLVPKVAKLMPEASFYIIGPHRGKAVYWLQKDKPHNLFLAGPLYGEELVMMLSRARVYLQLSEWESFGCALAEAMLCECAVVVSKIGAISEVAGDCGLYVDSFEPEEVADKIREASWRQGVLGPKARQRIIEKFPLKTREKELVAAIG